MSSCKPSLSARPISAERAFLHMFFSGLFDISFSICMIEALVHDGKGYDLHRNEIVSAISSFVPFVTLLFMMKSFSF